MEIFGQRSPSSETVGRALRNLVRPEKEKKPLVVVFYLTFSCNARCGFCSQVEYVYGKEMGRYKKDQSVDRQLEVLKVIRRDVPNIYFAGGEPTVYPGFERILRESVDLGFDTIGVNTNGLLFKPEILEQANLLVVSLHSADPAKIASIYRVAPRGGAQALDHVRRYAHERGPRMEMVLNCVVTGDSIQEVYGVADFCRELGVKLNVAPAVLEGGRPDARLIGNSKYHCLIDYLMGQNGLMASSRAYLEIIRDFEPFVCTPHVVPGVYPNGDVIAPCPNLPEGHEMVNALEVGGVNRALQLGRAQFERKHGILNTRTRCAAMCHKTCYISAAGFSTAGGLARLARTQFSQIF